ncbi:MAG: transcriptional regulator [Flavobacterium sp.]|nr:MAG: transcriptional regulator [Flavobacterium sp.]
MLSNACQYAIRSVLYLAIHSNEKTRIGVKTIAEELETPQPFLAKLLQQLAKSDLVSSIKGPHGGFYLTKKDNENSLWDIVTCIDGTDKFDNCFLGLNACDDKNPCPVHFIVIPFKQKLLSDFRDKTISQFTKEITVSGRVITLKDFNALEN